LTSNDSDPTPVHSENEILDRVYKRGYALQRRKLVARAASVVTLAAVLSVAGVAVAHQVGTPTPATGSLTNGSGPIDSPSPLLSPTRTQSQEPSPSVTGNPSEQPSPSASPIDCLNSTDPACGDFYWDPAPGPNAPLTVTLRASSNSVRVGETVTFTVTATDADAKIVCNGIYYDDEGAVWMIPTGSVARYGRWETPAKGQGDLSLTFTHAYAAVGSYKVQFFVDSGVCGDAAASPYGGRVLTSTTVTVTEATPSSSAS
jgi:hypothetical protein